MSERMTKCEVERRGVPGPRLRGAARAVVCRKTSSKCEVRTETNALTSHYLYRIAAPISDGQLPRRYL